MRSMVVILAAGWCVVAQAPVDPFDSVLVTYYLTPQQEAQFSRTDGVVSPFWSNWAGRDYIRMVPPDNCYPGRCSINDSTDARMVVRAAATEKGLYVYVQVRDDAWVESPRNYDGWQYDVVDLYYDTLSADSIWRCTDCLIGLYDSRLTFTTQQFQLFMGRRAGPGDIRLCYYDGAFMEFYDNFLTFENASVLFGYEGEAIRADSVHRAQEWFYPWVMYAMGIRVGTPLAGKRFAFTAGYNDRDSAADSVASLRWLQKDPWSGDRNYWGDLLMADDMPPVGPQQGVRRYDATKVVARVAASVQEAFDLRGRRLMVAGGQTARGITVRPLPDGRTTRVLHAN